MSQSASQACLFYMGVAKSRVVWTLKDEEGFVVFPTKEKIQRLLLFSTERKAIGLWSSQSRVMKIIQADSNLAKCAPVEIPWEEFVERWIPGLKRDRFFWELTGVVNGEWAMTWNPMRCF